MKRPGDRDATDGDGDEVGDDVGHESTQRLQTLQTATAMNLSHCQSLKSGRMAEATAAAAAEPVAATVTVAEAEAQTEAVALAVAVAVAATEARPILPSGVVVALHFSILAPRM